MAFALFVFFRHWAETAEDTSERGCENKPKTPRLPSHGVVKAAFGGWCLWKTTSYASNVWLPYIVPIKHLIGFTIIPYNLIVVYLYV